MAQLVEQTIRNRQVMGSNPIGGSPKISGFSPCTEAMQDGKTTMFYGKVHAKTIPKISQGDQVSATADSFLIDRQAGELSGHTCKFYREFLRTFIRRVQCKFVGIHPGDYPKVPVRLLSRVWRKA